MSTVKYPDMRRQIMVALAALADPQHQRRVWVEHIYPHENYFDSFDLNVHTLYDDTTVLTDGPASGVGDVLVEGDEIERLAVLDRALGPLIADLGDAPDEQYITDPRWPAVIRAAGSALTAMVLAGGF